MSVSILIGDVRSRLADMPDESVNTIVTSPPYYGLRSYLPDIYPDKAREIGLERTPSEFVETMMAVFRDARRVLRSDGVLFLNLGDSYSSGGREPRDTASPNKGNAGASQMHRPQDGLKPKDLIGIPWEVALALRADGWYLRDAIVWAKPNCMPGSQEDRCTSSYEMVFHLSKSESY